MINSAINYINNNFGNIITSGIFCILGAILGILVAPKDTNPNRTNDTSFKQIVILIQQTIIEKNTHIGSESKPAKKQKLHNNQSEDNSLELIFSIFIIVVILYSKYHTEILTTLSYFTFFTLASIITISIKLNRNNNLDKLNSWWIMSMLIITIFNFISIILISNQNTTLENVDFFTLVGIFYFAGGFLILVIPNIFMLSLLIHLFALNSFLVRQGKLSYFFLKNTKFLINIKQPKVLSIFIFGYCIISILLSSGVAYNFIKH